jgi:predicted aspartyl protease
MPNCITSLVKTGKIVAYAACAFLLSGAPIAAQIVPPVAADLPIVRVSQNNNVQSQDDTEIDPAAFIQLLELDSSDRMTVMVKINDSRQVPFIVDTGSERTVISNELARYLALSTGPQLRLATVSGPAQVNSFHIENLKTLKMEIGAINAPGLMQRNIGGFGLLGIDSLEGRKVLLDFRKGTMEVLPSIRKRGETVVEQGMLVVTATRRAGRMILSSADIGGTRVDIVLDTGTTTSIGNAALRRRLYAKDRSTGYHISQLRSVTGALMAAEFTQIKEIKIGELGITNLPIAFGNDYVFGALQLTKRPAILLGMDALKIFDRVVIDFGNRKVGFDLPANAR